MEEFKPRNREKSKTPRGRSYWCDGCDRNHVNSGQACSLCGRVCGKDRVKFSKRNIHNNES